MTVVLKGSALHGLDSPGPKIVVDCVNGVATAPSCAARTSALRSTTIAWCGS